jgi:hypothetical protein
VPEYLRDSPNRLVAALLTWYWVIALRTATAPINSSSVKTNRFLSSMPSA